MINENIKFRFFRDMVSKIFKKYNMSLEDIQDLRFYLSKLDTIQREEDKSLSEVLK